jgi:hypothetical protein
MSRKDRAVADVFPLVFGVGEKIDGAIGAEAYQHPKATSLALPRTGDPLLDDATAEVGVNQALLGALNGLDQARIADAVPTGKISQASWS